PRRGLTAHRVVLVRVPRADDVPALQLPVAQRTTLVRAPIVERTEPLVAAGQADRTPRGHDRRDPSDLEPPGVHLHPLRRVHHPPVPVTAATVADSGRA